MLAYAMCELYGVGFGDLCSAVVQLREGQTGIVRLSRNGKF